MRAARRPSIDGANIWVSGQFSGTVTKLQASDGANLGTFLVGNNPGGIVFDGANVWVTLFNDQLVLKL